MLKVSVVFYIAVYCILLVAAVLLWFAATDTGLRENIEKVIADLIASGKFHFVGSELLRAGAIGGAMLVVLGTAANVMLSVLYNLISDLVGGLSIVVEERSVQRVRRAPASDGTGASHGVDPDNVPRPPIRPEPMKILIPEVERRGVQAPQLQPESPRPPQLEPSRPQGQGQPAQPQPELSRPQPQLRPQPSEPSETQPDPRPQPQPQGWLQPQPETPPAVSPQPSAPHPQAPQLQPRPQPEPERSPVQVPQAQPAGPRASDPGASDPGASDPGASDPGASDPRTPKHSQPRLPVVIPASPPEMPDQQLSQAERASDTNLEAFGL